MLLIGVGLVFLAMQYFGFVLPFDLGAVGWPLFVIAPGFVLLIAGLFLPANPGLGLSIGGAIVTMVGLLLAYQSVTNHFASWAYAWALVAPAGVGAGMLLWGVVHLQRRPIRDGLSALAVGLVIFLIGFAFFEGILSIGGDRGLAPLGRQALPIALILAGVLVILTRLWPRDRGGRGHRAWNRSVDGPANDPAMGDSMTGPQTTDPTDRPTS